MSETMILAIRNLEREGYSNSEIAEKLHISICEVISITCMYN